MFRRHTGQRYFDESQEDQRLRVGLVGHWVGLGPGLLLPDRSGYGNHGTLVGGVVWTLGREGLEPALAFDGSATVVRTGASVISGGDRTYMAWVRLLSFQVGILIAHNTSVGPEFTSGLLTHTTAGNKFYYSTNAFLAKAQSVTLPVVGETYFVCGVTRSTENIIYVNGRQEGTSTHTPSSLSGQLVDIGARYSDLVSHAVIYGVRLYNRALSDSEIACLADPARRITAMGRRGRYVAPAAVTRIGAGLRHIPSLNRVVRCG